MDFHPVACSLILLVSLGQPGVKSAGERTLDPGVASPLALASSGCGTPGGALYGVEAAMQYRLGHLRLAPGANQDVEGAWRAIRRAAQLGHASAQLMYGARGLAQEGESSAALNWVRRAAAQGDERAIDLIVYTNFSSNPAIPRQERSLPTRQTVPCTNQ